MTKQELAKALERWDPQNGHSVSTLTKSYQEGKVCNKATALEALEYLERQVNLLWAMSNGKKITASSGFTYFDVKTFAGFTDDDLVRLEQNLFDITIELRKQIRADDHDDS